MAAGIETALRDPGARVALGIVRALHGGAQRVDRSRQIAHHLVDHPSAKVRTTAQAVLNELGAM